MPPTLGAMARAMGFAMVPVRLAVVAAGGAVCVHAGGERLPAEEQRRKDRKETETFHR